MRGNNNTKRNSIASLSKEADLYDTTNQQILKQLVKLAHQDGIHGDKIKRMSHAIQKSLHKLGLKSRKQAQTSPSKYQADYSEGDPGGSTKVSAEFLKMKI